MRVPRDAAEGLLTKAEHDLLNADTVLPTGQALDTVMFHAQQAVEKCLKALLTMRNIVYPLIHDVDELLVMALPYYPALTAFVDRTDVYAPYAVVGRYDLQTYPSEQETRDGLLLAHEIYEYALQVIANTTAE